MIGGIMAGGAGSRLAGVGDAKPLIEVAGVSLLARVFRQLEAAGARTVVVECSPEQHAVRRAAEHLGAAHHVPVQIVHAAPLGGTGSSVRSILEVAGDDDVLISTVDTVAPEGAYRRLVAGAQAAGAAAAVLATHHIQDEHPIYLHGTPTGTDTMLVDKIGKQVAPSDLCFGNVRWLSSPACRSVLELPVQIPESDLAFLRHVSAELGLHGVVVDPIFDIDDPVDLASAEAWLASEAS